MHSWDISLFTVGLKSQEDFFSVLHSIIKLFLTNNDVPP